MAAPILTDQMPLLYTNTKNVIDPVTSLPSSQAVGGLLYQYKAVVANGAVSKAVMIPQGNLVAIDYSYPVAPSGIYATLSSEADIKANAADWQAVPVNAGLSLAINAIYIDNTAGGAPVTVTINVRMFL